MTVRLKYLLGEVPQLRTKSEKTTKPPSRVGCQEANRVKRQKLTYSMDYNVGRIYKLFRYKEKRTKSILKDAVEVATVVIGGGLFIERNYFDKRNPV
jgi:hypothetical protein